MTQIRAEVIAIGDELTSGTRLDTNSQWISQRLGELGITVAFHSTVGDDLNDNIDVFRHAANRAEVIVATGGLGPTADDLTRQAIADMAGVELVRHLHVLEHIKQMYVSRGRDMPANNEIQAWFPAGSKIIDNPEGTAPGIDFEGASVAGTGYQVFALPGVPVEMKQMWDATVEPQLRSKIGDDFVIHHHTIHCFGSGESHIETLLPGLTQRGRDPQVGITASAATISLRISTRASTRQECLRVMQPTIATINANLGDLVFGENGIQLHEVVTELLKSRSETVAILDAGLNGTVAMLMDGDRATDDVVAGSKLARSPIHDLASSVADYAKSKGARYGLAIGPIDRDPRQVDSGESFYDVIISEGSRKLEKRLRFSGHSGWREDRAVKEVLNCFRLYLLGS